MNPKDIFAAAAERRQIADLVEGLSDAQLATPSLCDGWTVKTVAAHPVSVVADSFWIFQRAMLRRGSISRGIDALARRHARLPAAEIAAALRHHADRELSPPITGPLSGLTDVLVHSGDMRLPLGLPFNPDLGRTVLALDFLTDRWPLGFVPRGRLRGLSLRANDIDCVWGDGAEVRGTAAALMMSVSGRRAVLDALDGPGVPLLHDRL